MHNKNRRTRYGHLAAGLLLPALFYCPLVFPAEVHNPQQELIEALASGRDATALLKRLRHTATPVRTAADEAGGFDTQLQLYARQLHEFGAASNPDTDTVRALFDGYASLQAAHLLSEGRFDDAAQRIEAGAAGAEAAQRLQAARRSYRARFAAIGQPLDSLSKQYRAAENRDALAADPAFVKQLRKAANSTLEQITGHEHRPQPPILGSTFLPYRRLVLTQRAPGQGLPAVVPAYANANQAAPLGADLAGTLDAPLSQEILAQAKALGNDYIRIYEFVSNEIRTEWYAGSMKGAAGALRQRAGNDVDQASLLIALFRASGLPARYVQGVIELPIDSVMQSLGLNNAAHAVRALNLAGIPNTPVIRGGKVAAVTIEHTWVEAYVPYTNYRGTLVDASGSIWLPLAPALKKYKVVAASGIFSAAG
ncbi:MAG TPA: transglutaminase family protein, partial [Gammaproteobacteria bacterium]|nr:transglutaminase family protein [Gammaproteobacteria bacterium]